MRMRETELNRLLGMVAEHIDLTHCHEVDERYRRALTYADVDRPPLVVQASFGSYVRLPKPWDAFRRYAYHETFKSPVAMLQNLLLERVVPGILLKDDNPLAIRNNHGTIQIASALGAQWRLHEDNYPWVEPFSSPERLHEIAYSSDAVSMQNGVLPRSVETLRFYREELDQYPPCGEAIQISMPDLEGPFNTAEQLWGSAIYYALTDAPELLQKCLSRIVDVTTHVSQQLRPYTYDRLDPAANTQHGYAIPGRLLVRIDSAMLLSPSAYSEFVRPHDARLLRHMGTGSVHCCGNWQHLVAPLLDIPDLRGLDPGDPELMDIGLVYSRCRERGVALTNLHPPREALVNGAARQDFPTGAVLVYLTDSLDDALEVVRAYKGGTNLA